MPEEVKAKLLAINKGRKLSTEHCKKYHCFDWESNAAIKQRKNICVDDWN